MTRRRKASKRSSKKKTEATPSAPVGRPIELTDEVLERIAKNVEGGDYIETAANIEGVSLSSMRQMLRNGSKAMRELEDGKDPTLGADGNKLDDVQQARIERSMRFAMRIRMAKAKFTSKTLKKIEEAGQESWQALAWRLERMDPDKFGRRERHDHRHGGTKGGPIKHDHSARITLDPEKLKTMSKEQLDVLELAVTAYESGARDDSGGEGAPES